ncbi:MAG: restriction endonuclease subunit S [Chloroflexi bacterium]|nr:restriction endonuclease subunit S [Chloroflexota bacterium]
MTSPVDVRPDHLEIVQGILREHLPVGVKVWVFGSRANWTTKDSSDLDLAIEGEGNLSHHVLGALRDAFEDSTLPYTVDVVDLNRIGESFRQIVESQQVPLPLDGDEAEHQIRSAASPTADVFTDVASRTGNQNQWRRVALGDLIDLHLSGVDKKSKPNEQAVQLCNYMDVYSNSFIQADMEFMPATATEREIARCSLAAGDVVITKDSEKHDDIGVPALVREGIPNLVCGYHLAILRPQTSVVDGAYLFYALRADEAQEQFHSYANGITRFGLRKSDIGLVEVPLPPLPEQRAIAHVLRTLDDKIELNRRMNETLEAMARALFRSWFVDFDPVRAKMEGRDPGLPPEVAALFPERRVPSDLGEIPEGWEVKQLEEVVDVVGGTTPSTKVAEYWEDGTHCWATPKDLSALSTPVLLETERKITDAGLRQIGSGLLPPGTLLLSSRAPIGYLAVTEVPVAINQGFIAMPPKEGISSQFLLHWSEVFHEEIVNYANGSTFLEISKGNFRKILFVLPDSGALGEFNRHAQVLHQRIVRNELESRTLAVQRDALLPRLVSGEVKVGEVVGDAPGV